MAQLSGIPSHIVSFNFLLYTDDLVITMASHTKTSPPPATAGHDMLEMTGILLPHEHFTFLNCPGCKRVTFRGWNCDICHQMEHPTAFTNPDGSFFYHPLFIAMYFHPRVPGFQRPYIPTLEECFVSRSWEHILDLGLGTEAGSIAPVTPDDQFHTRLPIHSAMAAAAAPQFEDPDDPRGIRRKVLDYLVAGDYNLIFLSDTLRGAQHPPTRILCDRVGNHMIVAFQGAIIQLQWFCNDFTRAIDPVLFRGGW